ncbi:MAG: TonB family protein [Enhydrobacter sp.]|nr:TonB family protein [Enhydrobacter sp.]
MVVAAALSAERLPAPSTRPPRVSLALSFAFHGLAVAPLLFAGTTGSAPADEPAFVVEVSLAAPAPSDTTGPTDPRPAESSVDLPVPNEPRPVDATDVTPPSSVLLETKVDIPPPDEPQPVEIAEIAERNVELPAPEEPPALVAAELKPVTPSRTAEPPKPRPPAPPQAQPKPRPATHANPAPVRPTQSPAMTQTESAPNTGTAQVTQTAAAQQPTIVWEHHPRFRTPPRPAVYPPRAIELGQQGEALVRVRLQPNGEAAEILLWRGTGHELLDKAALTAVRGWQFLPAMRQGHAVAAWVEIPVRFHLR